MWQLGWYLCFLVLECSKSSTGVGCGVERNMEALHLPSMRDSRRERKNLCPKFLSSDCKPFPCGDSPLEMQDSSYQSPGRGTRPMALLEETVIYLLSDQSLR